MTLEQIRPFAEIGSAAVPIVAALAAGYWFLFTRSFRQRVELDCALRIFDVGESRPYLAELAVIVENKGQREHRMYNLWCEVRQTKRLTGEDEPASYLPLRNLVSRPMTYFFVPPGVRQTFPVPLEIPRDAKIVKATAIFVHQQRHISLPDGASPTLEGLNKLGFTPHSVERLFVVAPTDGPAACNP